MTYPTEKYLDAFAFYVVMPVLFVFFFGGLLLGVLAFFYALGEMLGINFIGAISEMVRSRLE